MKRLNFILLIFLSGCSVFGVNDTEQLEYEVLLSEDNKEIRLYKPFIKAQVDLPGKMDKKRDDSFKILAGYIFGKNKRNSNISMTSPVVIENSDVESEKISMTSPVVVNEEKEQTQMFFKMPSKYSLASLPKPKDERVKISEEPEKIYAVITYSGSWSKKDFSEKKKELKTWISGLGKYKIISAAKYAGYDPPWTLPWFKTNEVLLEISR